MCLEIAVIHIMNSMEKASFENVLNISLQKCFVFSRLYTLIVVFVGWFIFRIQSLDQASFLIDSVLYFKLQTITGMLFCGLSAQLFYSQPLIFVDLCFVII